ncbi:MAG: hypothetical protein LBU70_10925 [Chitinispirillales bacterium]|jgi:hypothetical protein|nr:hypothetical protein [Chitinispirillales bacterium]
MNQELLEAVAIAKELGWENVTPENLLSLPVGTAGQKRAALAGLKSGEWGEYGQLKKNKYGYRSYVDMDEDNLALFAIRVGVSARRAGDISHSADSKMLVDVIAERGAKYAANFITHACVSGRGVREHLESIVVYLVDRLDLEIPQNPEYIENWSRCADIAIDLKDQPALAGAASDYLKYGGMDRDRTDLPSLELIQKHFVEHIVTGVAVNAPVTGFFGAVFVAGVKLGWLLHEKAIELVFSALDTSIRPIDRKVWLNVLDEIGITAEEICARTQALIPLMSSGGDIVITRFAPTLIAGADEKLLTEVLLSAFSATTKKARLLVLKSALERPCPENAEELASWLSILASDKDKSVATLAGRLIKHWKISAEIVKEDESVIQGMWQKTPPVWKVPPFELGEVSPEALTDLATKYIINRQKGIGYITEEHFLAMANALAHQNPEAARASLRGLCDHLDDFFVHWIKGEKNRGYGFDTDEKGGIKRPRTARDYVVCFQLDKLPCLLSTPSLVDLTVTVPDLASRLTRYQEMGIDALEADLFLALTRLDSKTKTPESVKALEKLDVPILLQSGKKMSLTAGKAALLYLDDPVKETAANVKLKSWGEIEVDITMPDSLSSFPNRFSKPKYGGLKIYYLFSIFPLWGDIALYDVRWDEGGSDHEKGLVLRQVARRAAHLPPGASINLLAAQRSSTHHAQEDSMLAVTEAWERGLLRPGVADVSLLDWAIREPSHLAALATALDGIARDGLLSVVWPILDDLIAVSLKAPRLLSGTAELTELVDALLPEVQSAVEKGIADKTAFDLPAVRLLAQKSGSSRAVAAARKVVNSLPPAQNTPAKEDASMPVMETPFGKIWPARKTKAIILDDGVTVKVDWANTEPQLFLFTLTLPGITDRVFQVVKRWYSDLEREEQYEAYSLSHDAATTAFAYNKGELVWLHWDTKAKAMVVGMNDGPLKGAKAPPLSMSQLTVAIGLLAQDGDAVHFAPSFLKKSIKSGKIDENVVRIATRTLLQSPVVSPAKLVRILEKDIKLLPTLWPMLTECIKHAGALAAAGENPPVWINRVLDITLRYSPYLAEAAKRGFIPADDAQWPGLLEMASSKAKSTAVGKAKKLLTLLG